MPRSICPVCGYGFLRYPPVSPFSCPCCSTEFGKDDVEQSHEDLRKEWVVSGCPWQSLIKDPPLEWEPYEQMEDAQFMTRFNQKEN